MGSSPPGASCPPSPGAKAGILRAGQAGPAGQAGLASVPWYGPGLHYLFGSSLSGCFVLVAEGEGTLGAEADGHAHRARAGQGLSDVDLPVEAGGSSHSLWVRRAGRVCRTVAGRGPEQMTGTEEAGEAAAGLGNSTRRVQMTGTAGIVTDVKVGVPHGLQIPAISVELGG